MRAEPPPTSLLVNWRTVLGEAASLGERASGRDLWPVTGRGGERFFLKRLGPWRNLPLADEARILRHLTGHGVPVAEFLPTDHATLYAGGIADSFVLMPCLPDDAIDAIRLVALGDRIGEAIARMHTALAGYPWPANSYREQTVGALQGDLLLPPTVAEAFARRRDQLVATLSDLPEQLIHGDLTPGNVLLRRPDDVGGFIDFDHLPLASRTWDIARYLSRRVRLRWRRASTLSDADRLAHVPGVLHGYQRVLPLTGSEIEAVVAEMAAGTVLEASYSGQISAGLLDRRRLPDHDDDLADAIEAADWLLTGYDRIHDWIVDAIRR